MRRKTQKTFMNMNETRTRISQIRRAKKFNNRIMRLIKISLWMMMCQGYTDIQFLYTH